MRTNPDPIDDTAAFEQALMQIGEGHYVLRLYLTGHTSRSLKAVQAVKELCEGHLPGRYELEIVDLCQQPERAGLAGGLAHTIKGAAANVGGMAMGALAGELEKAGKAGRLDTVVALAPELQHQFDLLQECMRCG